MKSLFLLIAGLILSVSGFAQEYDSTGNLVYTTTNPAPTGTNIGQSWTGFTNVTSTGGNSTSDNGAVTGYNLSTGTFMFGYNQGTIAYTYAINQALANAGTGIQVRGYNWSWEINNLNYDDRQGSVDTLTARILTYTADNVTVRRTDTWTYNTKFDWTTFSGTVNYATPGPVSDFGNMRIEFTGRDAGFWAGYYGPMVRNIDVRLLYSVDPCVADPQSSPSCPGFKTYYNIWDDDFAQVNLPFVFPFYGQNFSTSYFQSNGVISFQNSGWGFCCSGPNLQQLGNDTSWNYTLLPLAVDLIASDPSSRFYTQSDSNYMRYTWENINQIGTNNLNTFSVEIRPTGYIGFTYNDINLSGNTVTSGIVGNASQGEYKQIYHGSGSNFNLSGTYTFTGTEIDQCYTNPLSSMSCPGYQQAFYDQQCSQDPLYDQGCPGYYQANYNLQCSISALYDQGCPGYEQAYFDQQCGISALYSTSCPGYQQAYFNQQCSISALYSTSCPGYEQAYFDQQCGISALYSTSCPGYEQAYFDQQCGISALYSTSCPGYAAAFVQENQSPAENTTVAQPTATSGTQELDPTRNESVVVIDAGGVELSLSGEIATPTGQTEAAKEAAKDAEKEEAQKEEEKKQTNSRARALARSAADTATRLAESRAEEAVVVSQLDQSVSDLIGLGTGITLQGFRPMGLEDGQDNESIKEVTANAASTAQNNIDIQVGSNTNTKEVPGSQPPTGPSVRRGGAVEGMEGGPNIADMARAPMDFNQYLNSQLTDSRFYESKEIYRGQRTVDNARAQRFLNAASDRLHQEMVDQQYGR